MAIISGGEFEDELAGEPGYLNGRAPAGGPSSNPGSGANYKVYFH